MQIAELFQVTSIVVAAISVVIASYTFILTQKWQRLRFSAEVVDKIYSDDNLWLAIQFLEWHDREIVLPERYRQYGDSQGKFAHKVANMSTAMNLESRCFDEDTQVYDLREEFRRAEYIIYVEVLDQFFDYLCRLERFMEEGLVKEKDVEPLVNFVRRLDSLDRFGGYLEKYKMTGVIALFNRFRKSSYGWVQKAAPQ